MVPGALVVAVSDHAEVGDVLGDHSALLLLSYSEDFYVGEAAKLQPLGYSRDIMPQLP